MWQLGLQMGSSQCSRASGFMNLSGQSRVVRRCSVGSRRRLCSARAAWCCRRFSRNSSFADLSSPRYICFSFLVFFCRALPTTPQHAGQATIARYRLRKDAKHRPCHDFLVSTPFVQSQGDRVQGRHGCGVAEHGQRGVGQRRPHELRLHAVGAHEDGDLAEYRLPFQRRCNQPFFRHSLCAWLVDDIPEQRPRKLGISPRLASTAPTSVDFARNWPGLGALRRTPGRAWAHFGRIWLDQGRNRPIWGVFERS